MKRDQNHSITEENAEQDKRFSIKEFFKTAEPETTHWNKLNEEDELCILGSNTEEKKSAEQLISIVRGMINIIEIQVLIDEQERLGFSGE